MKRKNLIFILPGMIFIFSASGAMRQTTERNKARGDWTQKDTLIYTYPMHPEIKSDVPGRCPECRMELVKKSKASKKKHKMKMTRKMRDTTRMENSDSARGKIANDSTQQYTLIYTCSMHPEIQSDESGSCPKCGMALVQKGGQPAHNHKMGMRCPMEHGMNDMNHPKKNKMLPVAIGMGLMMTIMLVFSIGN